MRHDELNLTIVLPIGLVPIGVVVELCSLITRLSTKDLKSLMKAGYVINQIEAKPTRRQCVPPRVIEVFYGVVPSFIRELKGNMSQQSRSRNKLVRDA